MLEAARKYFFKVSLNDRSQECVNCHYFHPHSCKSQSIFSCVSCGHTDHADINAGKVIQCRAMQLIKNLGTGLLKGGVLSPRDTGREADVRLGHDENSTHVVPKNRQK